MPTSSQFIANMNSQQVVILVLVQPIVSNTLVSSIPVTCQAQPAVLKNVSVSSSIPLVSGQAMPLPGGKNLNVSMVSGATNVSGSQTHMLGMNQPSSSMIHNPVDPTGSSNV